MPEYLSGTFGLEILPYSPFLIVHASLSAISSGLAVAYFVIFRNSSTCTCLRVRLRFLTFPW